MGLLLLLQNGFSSFGLGLALDRQKTLMAMMIVIFVLLCINDQAVPGSILNWELATRRCQVCQRILSTSRGRFIRSTTFGVRLAL